MSTPEKLIGRPEDQWLYSLPPASRLLFIGENDSATLRFIRSAAHPSIEIETHSPQKQDLRLRSFPREHYSSVYWEHQDKNLSLEHAQRIVANLFQALAPRTGKLALSRPVEVWQDTPLESLLRQTGFTVVSSWKSPDQKLWVCQRV